MLKYAYLFYCCYFLISTANAVERLQVTGQRSDFLRLNQVAQESLTEVDIQRRNLLHSEDLWSQFANMSTASGSNRTRYFKIRGIGERSEYDTVPSNSVGLFYDHIDLGGLGGALALYDVAQIEVLKGPQTFLYGDSALGGNVLLSSSDTFRAGSSVWAGVGSQEQRVLGFKSSIEITESFAIKAGLQKSQSRGFFYNSYLNDWTSDRVELFAHLGLQWEPRWFELRTIHILGENHNGNDLWNTDGSYTTLSDRRGLDNQLTHGHSIELTGQFTEGLQYVLISSLSQSDQDVAYDEDWGNNDQWRLTPGWNKDYDFFRSYQRRKTNFHSKAIVQHQGQGWEASYGLHFYQRKEQTEVSSYRKSVLRKNLMANHIANKMAVLLNFRHWITAKTDLSLSARSETQTIDYTDSNSFSDQKTNTPLAFNFVASHEPNNHRWTLTIARGFKGAGFNPEINLTPAQQSYDPEHVMNYEISWRHSGTVLENNVALFYMDRRDHQITTSSQDDPTDPSQFTLFVDNAAKSQTYGLEWQLHWKASPMVSLSTSLGLLQAEFVDYQLRNKSYAGRSLAHTPNYTLSTNLNLDLSSNLSWNLSLNQRDRFYYSNSHDQQSKSVFLINTNLNYQVTNELRLVLWARNLMGARSSQRGFYFGNEPPDFNPRLYEQSAPPREYGVRASYDF